MSTILLRKPPEHFKTLPLSVEATPEQLVYQGLGQPLNFSEMLERRRPVEVDDPQRFSLELANLGVSVRLTLSWQEQDYWVLVRQKRNDRGDEVLKMISGYVPAQEVGLPLLTAIQEVAEECLLETPQGWLSGRFGETWLPAPYDGSLNYRESPTFALSALSGAARQLYHGSQRLLERPRAYVHLPTASLQLVYDMRLEVPGEARQLSLYHVDEYLEEGRLIARLRREQPDLYLIPLEHGQPRAELLTLAKGKPQRQDTRDIWLSEGFAAQQGWVVQAERIRWEEWLAAIARP
ncbi:metal ABC transporter ATPase [Stutzerimonas kirkiae]|uniref:Metal ABC transporter ATPase n=1 Tax=Stutzerimonas kirkiae TaxID=2211392 RepID=A0A4Q9R0M4_9GAMM|nr:metal ABC transporter ATPase [Stutzerimonas kirkiae]TBU92003.1 metal ABC transporter ATPase [Stutzerimonas kirkiae]TBU99446.1 metal ABC transporter ATPase [Stutzerimonas kirkiae]TBV05563.1 metal ABC transporter ATPase [Stutzerimonas kirkiae]TBV10697.1 metal ABC transporter ATPase [Stutzerimonas kirkiae]